MMKSVLAWSCGVSLVISVVGGTSAVLAETKKQENRCDKYALITGSYTWSQALANAVTRGGRLATVSSAEESACVGQVLSGTEGWLGGSDQTNDGEWRWSVPKNGLFWRGLSDGIAYGYTNWNSGEPNGGPGENCVQAFSISANWNDLYCDSPLNYVIRYP